VPRALTTTEQARLAHRRQARRLPTARSAIPPSHHLTADRFSHQEEFMERRQFVQRLGIGSGVIAAAAIAQGRQDPENHGHHKALTGPLANATIGFGAWPAGSIDAPVDRTLTPLAPVAPNTHALLPQTVRIKEGGSVNFVLAGFHQVLIYTRKKPEDVDTGNLLPIPGAPPVVGLIEDPVNRVYRGLDPRLLSPAPPAAPNLLSQDRVEVVSFERRGTYMVICGVNVHFADGMIGYVEVIR
jgi:plastocyanin